MKKTTALALSLATALFAGQALAEHHEGKGHHKGHMFEETDTNKDGKITKAEFQAQGDKIFAKMDTDGDGVITKEETEAKRKEWEAKRAEWKAKREATKAAE